MKKVLGILGLSLLVSNTLFAQFPAEDYLELEEVFSLEVNYKTMGRLVNLWADKSDREDSEAAAVSESLDRLQVIATKDTEISKQISISVEDFLKGHTGVKEIQPAGHNNPNIKFYIKPGKDQSHADEIFMFASGMKKTTILWNKRRFKTVWLSMTGTDIDLNKMEAFTEKMGLPKALKKLDNTP